MANWPSPMEDDDDRGLNSSDVHHMLSALTKNRCDAGLRQASLAYDSSGVRRWSTPSRPRRSCGRATSHSWERVYNYLSSRFRAKLWTTYKPRQAP